MDIFGILRPIKLPYGRPKPAELSSHHIDGTWIFELPNHVLSMDLHTYRDSFVVDTISFSPWAAGKSCCQRMS